MSLNIELDEISKKSIAIKTGISYEDLKKMNYNELKIQLEKKFGEKLKEKNEVPPLRRIEDEER